MEKKPDVVKRLETFMEKIDKRIENVVTPMLLKHINIHWETLAIIAGGIVASIGLHAVILIYVNDKTVKSNIEISMVKHTEKIDKLEVKMETYNSKMETYNKEYDYKLNLLVEGVNQLITQMGVQNQKVSSLEKDIKNIRNILRNRKPDSVIKLDFMRLPASAIIPTNLSVR